METDLIGPRFNAPHLPPAFISATQLPTNSRLFLAERQGALRIAVIDGIENISDGSGGLTPAYKLAGMGIPHVLMQDVVDGIGTEAWNGRDMIASPTFAVAREASYTAPGAVIKPS